MAASAPVASVFSLTGACDLRELLGLEQPLIARCVGAPTGRGRLERLLDAHAVPLLLVDGAVLESVNLRQRSAGQLLGPGDIVAPASAPAPFAQEYRLLEPSRFAALDGAVLGRLTATRGGLPAVLNAVTTRATALGQQLIAAQMINLVDRMRTILPVIAERWGVVSAGGVVLPAFLTHGVLATLLGARRPSVTTALAPLHDSGALRRLADGRWTLDPEFAGVG